MLTLTRTGEDRYKSTYGSFYSKSPKDTKRRKQYYQYPRLCGSDSGYVIQKEHQDQLGKRKYVRPPGLSHDNPACLGLGSFGDHSLLNTQKEIVRMNGPDERLIGLQHVKNRPSDVRLTTEQLKSSTLQELIKRVQLISTAKREEKPYCLSVPKWNLPDSTVEENADMLRYRAKRYENENAEWQISTTTWDRAQFRPNYNDISHSYVPSGKLKALEKKKAIEEHRHKLIRSLLHNQPFCIANQCNERKLPGYSGFVPREPVECTFDKIAEEKYRSSSRRAYRDYSRNAVPNHHPINRHCTAPMSRMVTLVYPSNPFKKTPNTVHSNIKPVFH